jgi:HSP20 family protein
MSLRPDPLQELLDLQERMNRLFDETLSRETMDDPRAGHTGWAPVADVLESSETYVVEVELPGIGRDDVVVQAQGDELVVRGERPAATGARPESFHRMERQHGPFSRVFRFPEKIDPERVAAEFADGVLRLTVPKARPRSSRVRVERGQ